MSAQTVNVIIGRGSSTLDTMGARAVANLETKFSMPNEVEENNVGNTEEWAT